MRTERLGLRRIRAPVRDQAQFQLTAGLNHRLGARGIAFVSFILLLLMLLTHGTAAAEGIAQEKGTGVMELLVCRVRPRDLLAGNVLGIGLVGLGQMLLALLAGGVAIVALDTVEAPAAVPAAPASAVLWFALGYAIWSVALTAVGPSSRASKTSRPQLRRRPGR